MIQILLPLVMIASSVGLYFGYIDQTYQNIKVLNEQKQEYDAAIQNANQLTERRNALVSKVNALPSSEVDRLNKLIPDYVDSVRLIMEVDRIALKYGMSLREVRTDDLNKGKASETLGTLGAPQKDYDNVNLSFSVLTTYQVFKQFMAELESNLRVSDVNKISFTAPQGSAKNQDLYQFGVSLKTYWLK